ncbi:hypothetical protein K9B43_07090 [Pseudomonas sp. S5(2021)]|uniref:hypothetical protein n=1 Tax=Stutzerimonas balearica TaxID=74829 RepID=UPI000773D017|nr:hypothetical protein [Stutzerimonas balearica]MBZ5755382.1 hypothetical protein [Pseudomonas sp. S5(2021)]OMG62944.1 hypothetical protein AUR61_015840 [Stutzerimonas balearica]
MKLEIARGVFLVGALGVASLCFAAWNQPSPGVVRGNLDRDHCPIPAGMRVDTLQVRPDADLLLFLYGMSQQLGVRG